MNIKTLKTLLEALDDNASQATQSPAEIPHPWEVGKVYFIRTVTYHLTGRIVSVLPGELVISEAAWIAESGRFSDALKKEEFSEVEPFPNGSNVIVNRAAVVDAVQISSPQLSIK